MIEFALTDLLRVTEDFWPEATAEGWDRVGLVSGNGEAPLRRVLLAVDAVRDTVDEAVNWQADALFTHHPLLLRGVYTVSEQTSKGSLLASLIRHNCALFTAHTNADSPEGGVSDTLAARLGLEHSTPLVIGADPAAGIGRVGTLPTAVRLAEFAERIAALLPQTVSGVRVAGDPSRMIQCVALCGGAGDSLLDNPGVLSADVYVTSDLRHHPAQESIEQSIASGGPALIDISHWAAESLWLQSAADRLSAALPGVEFRVSEKRTDPWTFAVGCDS